MIIIETTAKKGCLVCGKPLNYFVSAVEMNCAFCGSLFETNASCEEGHYVCDKCHVEKGFESITDYALKTKSKNPFVIAKDMMKNGFIHMHGPEHHYLTVASLLSAYKNAGGDINLEDCLNTARQRAKNVPGSICGLWGSCGAGISSGMFISIITGATPLSAEEWSLANLMTSQSLEEISKNGGPRCCKRNTLLAISKAVPFVKQHMNVEMDVLDKLSCEFYYKNKQCRKNGCLFYPTSD